MIDAHCHLEYMENAGEVITEAKRKGMAAIITSIADIKDKEKVISLKKKYPDFVFICLGFHPEIMKDYADADIDDYIEFIRQNKNYIAAIGETGLDYNWITNMQDQERSKEIFQKFIDLSKELHLPLVIHSRNGKENKDGSNDGIGDAIGMLIQNNCKNVMMHCFSGNETQLRTCLEQGWVISYATVIAKSFKHQRLAKSTPLEQMVLETDSPWLDPDSPPGSSLLTNRPWKIERGAEVLAQLKGTGKEEILQATSENTRRFFRV